MKKQPIQIIQGGNYGSEAKGLVAGEMCKWNKVDYAVRTGSINAGHTVYFRGKAYKMQQIPVGWVNPGTKLVIGAGAYVHAPTLKREIETINEATNRDVRARLYIDKRAAVHLDSHHNAEQGAKLHERMGSTGEGVAAAIVDKMGRKFEYKLFSQTSECQDMGLQVVDTVKMLNDAYDKGKLLLLEGTQGTMLDFHLGHYPFVTSRQTTATAWATEAGLSPSLEYEVALVVRAWPIRVAGNSGPLSQEVSWESFAERINNERVRFGQPPMVSPNALSKFRQALAKSAEELKMPGIDFAHWDAATRQRYSAELSAVHRKAFESLDDFTMTELKKLFEMTTVTKKLRRIAALDFDELRYAVMINRPSYVVLTFLNYTFPTLWEANSWKDILNSYVGEEVKRYIKKIEREIGVEVRYVNTNPLNLIKVR